MPRSSTRTSDLPQSSMRTFATCPDHRRGLFDLPQSSMGTSVAPLLRGLPSAPATGGFDRCASTSDLVIDDGDDDGRSVPTNKGPMLAYMRLPRQTWATPTSAKTSLATSCSGAEVVLVSW
ncbi:hypothetical protein GGX14DRAFT_387653 [Mycena pura]|uniref:Uncharacterized protein n=1 Tax=Mycena pura TaxID=153505 RepID=A0AAD7E1X4_9AGAR|nr:hypothetical protein GGX14DRAFT_387653 [Mycena pura]